MGEEVPSHKSFNIYHYTVSAPIRLFFWCSVVGVLAACAFLGLVLTIPARGQLRRFQDMESETYRSYKNGFPAHIGSDSFMRDNVTLLLGSSSQSFTMKDVKCTRYYICFDYPFNVLTYSVHCQYTGLLCAMSFILTAAA